MKDIDVSTILENSKEYRVGLVVHDLSFDLVDNTQLDVRSVQNNQLSTLEFLALNAVVNGEGIEEEVTKRPFHHYMMFGRNQKIQFTMEEINIGRGIGILFLEELSIGHVDTSKNTIHVDHSCVEGRQ
jgi:hypothetical protein